MTVAEQIAMRLELRTLKAKQKASNARFLVACLVSWGLGVMTALGVSSYGGQAETLQRMAMAYEVGHLGDFQALFAPEAVHQGNPIGHDLPDYGRLFVRPEPRVLRFYDVTVHPDGTGAAWFDVQADGTCSGLVEWEMNQDRITEWSYRCFDDQLQFDGALAGQSLDVASTVYALSSDGFIEGNPVVSAAPGIVLPLKLLGSRIAEELEAFNCRTLKAGLAFAGFGAGTWNICTMLGGAAALCAPAGIAAGWMLMAKTEEFHATACRRHDNIDFVLIDSTQVIANGG